MSPIRSRHALRLLPVLALPVAALVLGQSASASVPPTAPDDSGPVASLPEGYVRLVDDTGSITVVVPQTWSTIATASAENTDGSAQPTIFASGVDRETFDTTFASGVVYVAIPYTDDPQTVIDAGGLTQGCETIGSSETVVEGTVPVDSDSTDVAVEGPGLEPYEDPIFTGLVQVGENCGESAGTWNMIVASPADQSFTAVIQLQIESDDDQEAFDTVLQSFTYAGDPTVDPSTMVPSAPSSSVPG